MALQKKKGPAVESVAGGSSIVRFKRGSGGLAMAKSTVSDDVICTMEPPENLSAKGRAHWKRTVKVIAEKYGMINDCDIDLLTVHCSLYARWAELDKRLSIADYVSNTASGHGQVNPEFTIMRQLAEMVQKTGKQLGMSPTGRSALDVRSTGKKSESLDG